MAAGISISVASDTRAFSQGVKNGVVEPLEDVENALKDVDKASDKAGDALVEDMKAAQKQTDKLGDEYKSLGDVIKKESKEAGRNIDKGFKDGLDDASDGVKDFKSEAKQNAEEVAASFDGSVESIADGFQGLAATALSGFGPLGAVAGLALAAGLGAAFTQFTADAEAAKELLGEQFDDMIESGKAYASEEFINDSLKDIVKDSGKLSEAQKDAAALGVELSTVLRAQAGDAAALNDVNGAANDKFAAIRDRMSEIGDKGAPIPGQLQGQATAAEKLSEKYSGLAGNLSTAAGQAAIFREAQVGAGSATETAKTQVDNFNNAVSQIQTQKSLNVDVDTSAAEAKLNQLARNRTVVFNVDGQVTRIGNQVW